MNASRRRGPGVDDEDAADRRLAVVGDQRAGGHDVDAVIPGAVEMDAMVAVMLGPRRQDVLLIERVDDEQHGGILLRFRAAGERHRDAVDSATERSEELGIQQSAASKALVAALAPHRL